MDRKYLNTSFGEAMLFPSIRSLQEISIASIPFVKDKSRNANYVKVSRPISQSSIYAEHKILRKRMKKELRNIQFPIAS